MSVNKKPIPKSQRTISQGLRERYLNDGDYYGPNLKDRHNQLSVKGDRSKSFYVTLYDIDKAVLEHVQNTIKPTVTKNGQVIDVPIIAASPELWKSSQLDGYLKDNKGKIMAPVISFIRTSVEKNRGLGNKLDANNVYNYAIFEQKFSRRNVYTSIDLRNRIPQKEYHAIVIPDYVTISYSFNMFTDHIESMTKLIEAFNYASDSYWGEENKYRFRVSIDSFSNTTDVQQDQDRTVRTEFTATLQGYIIPDTVNKEMSHIKKVYSKSRIIFNFEIVSTEEELIARIGSGDSPTQPRVFDQGTYAINNGTITSEEYNFIELHTVATADSLTSNEATFLNHTIATPPVGFDPLTKENFQIFINGQYIQPEHIISITQIGSDIVVTFNTTTIGFTLGGDEVILAGKFN